MHTPRPLTCPAPCLPVFTCGHHVACNQAQAAHSKACHFKRILSLNAYCPLKAVIASAAVLLCPQAAYLQKLPIQDAPKLPTCVHFSMSAWYFSTAVMQTSMASSFISAVMSVYFTRGYLAILQAQSVLAQAPKAPFRPQAKEATQERCSEPQIVLKSLAGQTASGSEPVPITM